MDISPVTTAQQTITSDASSSQAKASASVIGSDFETFLQMLTTQARYQDPLEPIDSSEYSAQLAQFSMVEQQVKSNELLEALAGRIGSGSIGELAGWIGMEARTTAPAMFDGDPITVTPPQVTGADEAYLVVYNEAGDLVQRQTIAELGKPVQWDGLDDSGTAFEPGRYTFKVESSVLGNVFSTDPAETYSRVVETRLEGDASVLILDSGSSVTSDAVTGLRQAI